MNPRPPGYEPGELPDCSTPRRGPDCSTVVTIIPVNWLIYLALILSVFAVAGALAFAAVRALQAWRALKRLRRHLAKEQGRLTDLGERTAENAARATDTSELDEATATFGRLTAFYPRK